MAIKKDDAVRYVTPAIEGKVVSKVFDEDTDGFQLLVEWTDPNGDTHQRWFTEGELELVTTGV